MLPLVLESPVTKMLEVFSLGNLLKEFLGGRWRLGLLWVCMTNLSVDGLRGALRLLKQADVSPALDRIGEVVLVSCE